MVCWHQAHVGGPARGEAAAEASAQARVRGGGRRPCMDGDLAASLHFGSVSLSSESASGACSPAKEPSMPHGLQEISPSISGGARSEKCDVGDRVVTPSTCGKAFPRPALTSAGISGMAVGTPRSCSSSVCLPLSSDQVARLPPAFLPGDHFLPFRKWSPWDITDTKFTYPALKVLPRLGSPQSCLPSRGSSSRADAGPRHWPSVAELLFK